MPLILGWINSAGSNDVLQNRWQMVMTVFAVLAFAGCILEYFFTRERITEEDMVEPEGEMESVAQKESAKSASAAPSTLEQLKGAAADSYWWIIIIFYLLYQAGVMFKGGYVFNIFCHEFFQEVHIFGMTLTADMAQSVLARSAEFLWQQACCLSGRWPTALAKRT